MKNLFKLRTTLLVVGCMLIFNPEGYSNNDMPTKKSVLKSMTRVCDWQLSHLQNEYKQQGGKPEKVTNTNWVRATFLTGLMAQYQSTQQQIYLDSAVAICAKNDWQCGPKPRHADDLTIGQVYLEIYKLKKDTAMISGTKKRLDAIVANSMRGPLVGWKNNDNWAWCDALYMAPPVFARMYDATKDIAYLNTMDTLWTDTYNLLYDKSEKLFYRDARFILKPDGTQQLTGNGKKVFWGRGNGWVVGGLVRILQYMPQDYPARKKYEQIFKDMCERISSLQNTNGVWGPSLLDTVEYPTPETSGSGFYCYAIAWGVNNGLLEKGKYQPIALKAWKGLSNTVNKETGMLGWVQQIGFDPRHVTANDTQEYGAGAFLLAGSEIVKLKK